MQSIRRRETAQSIGAIYELLESKKDQVDPRVFLPPIMDTVMYGMIPDEDVAAIVDCVERGVKEVVGTLIVQFGSFGKAPLVEQVTLDEMIERYKKMEKFKTFVNKKDSFPSTTSLGNCPFYFVLAISAPKCVPLLHRQRG